MASLILSLTVLNSQWLPVHAQDAPVLRIQAPKSVGAGQVILLQLVIEGKSPKDIGGLEAEVLYDHQAAEYAGFSPPMPPENASYGNLVVPESPGGSVIGYYRCSTPSCLKSRGDIVQMALSSAATDSGTIAQIELYPRTSGSLDVKLGHLRIVDPTGQPIAVTVADPSFVVQVAKPVEQPTDIPPEDPVFTSTTTLAAAAWEPKASAASAMEIAAAADVTADGVTNHADVMEVAIAWQIVWEAGMPCSGREAYGDLNRDGCVDISDVQAAAAWASPNKPEVPPLPYNLRMPLISGNEAGTQDSTAKVAATGPLTLTVNSTLDEWDKKVGDRICLTASGVCTLRAALNETNANPGPDTIIFNIPGGGVQTIQLSDKLPTLTDSGTIIDGYTQPGATPNTDDQIDNAAIKIQIRGNGYAAHDGIVITSSNNTIRGVALFNLRRSIWIYGTAATDNVIVGNFIGTDAAGVFIAPAGTEDQAHGVNIEQQSKRNRIGTSLTAADPAPAADRNVISGNAKTGVGIWHGGTSDNIIYNNIVGLSPDGTRRLKNYRHGVDINFDAGGNIVGGTGLRQHNVLSGNGGKGMEVSHGEFTGNNQIIGNYIGLDPTGEAGDSHTGNEFPGVTLKDRAQRNLVEYNIIGENVGGGVWVDNYGTCCAANNTIRNNWIGITKSGKPVPNQHWGVSLMSPSSTVGPGNIIAYNPRGLEVVSPDSDYNVITRNSFFNNDTIGIDLGPQNQINLNDPGDADSGPNQQLNFPELATATTLQVTGQACLTCTVEIFIADVQTVTYGEGKTFVGSGRVAADGTFTVNVGGAKVGDYVTATAIDDTGNTSEFSLNKVVTAAQTPPGAKPIPGRIEAEDYRPGGSGVGYRDSTPGNTGGAYRQDDVDIQNTLDTTGTYNVGWLTGGEWLAYDVFVATTGNYQVTARVATNVSGKQFYLEVDGANVTGVLTVPNTGSMQKWADLSTTISLSAGPHLLRFVAVTGSYNVNYFNFVAQ